MSNTRRSRNKSKIVSKLAHQYIQMGTCIENRLLVSKIRNWPLGSKSKDRPLGSKIENRPLGSKIKTRPLGSKIKKLATGVQNQKSAILFKIDNQISATCAQNRKSDTGVQNLTKVKLPTRDHDLKLGFVSRKNSKNSDILKSYWLV